MIKLTFKDGSSVFLAHHGIKGMHWGEWNEETKEKYGIVDDDGGLSKLKAFRETSYTLPKGTQISRFTGLDEARKGDTLSRPHVYASHNEHDFNTYADMASTGDLPGASDHNVLGRLTARSGLVRMSSVDDIVVARGNFVVDELFRETGSIPSHVMLTDPKTHDRFRKMGYDAIEDVQDQLLNSTKATHPLIVVNPDKMRVDDSSVYWRRHPPSWDR